jgi:hypothetical protein
MHEGDLLATYLMLTSVLHQRLGGDEFDLMRFVKNAFCEICTRWVPEEPVDEGCRIFDGEQDYDLNYLDDEEA